MLSPRVIPTLLLKDMGLVKGVRFKDHKYVGDPMNAVRIFNGKNADELFLLDITASARGAGPDPEFVQRVADECYMPFGVGGGIRTVEQIGRLVRSGAEKVAINTAALARPEFIGEAAGSFGSQCVVVSIDVGRDLFGRPKVFSHNGSRKTSWDPVDWARRAAELGAGEILLTSIAHEGCGGGYDLDLVRSVADAVPVPVIASGGAGQVEHLSAAFGAGATAAAAGSMFVFKGKLRSVLIQYFK
jgi:imidazole glycerol-phosphate synthase subunit HisF